MKNGLPYYKAYPRDFIEGTIGMPFELKGAYRLVLDLIYMQGGKLPDDPRYISGLLGCSIRKWKSLRSELVQLGKIKVSGEFLTNYRAEKELETLAKLQEKQSEKASRSRKNKDLQKPQQSQPEPEPEPYSSDTNVSDAPASPDPEKVMFDSGVKLIVASGVSEQKARSFLGMLRRDHGTPAVIEAIGRAYRDGATEPVAFIRRCLNKSKKLETAGAFGNLPEVG